MDSNYVGILSDQGRAATASNLSEYTIHFENVQYLHWEVLSALEGYHDACGKNQKVFSTKWFAYTIK